MYLNISCVVQSNFSAAHNHIQNSQLTHCGITYSNVK